MLKSWKLRGSTAANNLINIILSKPKDRDEIGPENDKHFHLITIRLKTLSDGELNSYNQEYQSRGYLSKIDKN